MRHIQHPGPAALHTSVVPVTLTPREVQLRSGVTLLDALHEAIAALNARSGVARLTGGRFFPFAYAMPALSRTSEHAVYFSDRFDAAEPVSFEAATVTFGVRADGRPWLHCHADWRSADGQRHCGHVLPEDAVLIEAPARAELWALHGAAFTVVADDETRFSLFKPLPVDDASTAVPCDQALAVAVRLSPNQDVCRTLEAVCRAHGRSTATLRGGVGSTVGAVFDDGRIVEPFVTETLVRQGRIVADADGQPRAEIDVTMVDYLGGQHQGRLARGQNPVLVTFELVLAFD